MSSLSQQLNLPNFTEFLKKYLCCLISNPPRYITLAWYISMGLVFIAFLCACIAASYMDTSTEDSTAVAFAGVWTVLILIFVSIATTLIMRKFQTSLSIGFLLGMFFVLANQMLIIFAIFINHARSSNVNSQTQKADNAFAAFSFLLFIIYSIYGSMLGVFRNDMIKEDTIESNGHVEVSQVM